MNAAATAGRPAAGGRRAGAGARLAVVIPVGPREDLADVADTLDSVAAYAGPDTSVVLVNDGARPGVRRLAGSAGLPVEALDVPGEGQGVAGGLAWATAWAMRAAVADRRVDLILRLDTDALFTGPGLAGAARAAFAADPGLGLLGSSTLLSTGEPRDLGPAAWMLQRDLRTDRRRRPVWTLNLRRVLRAARRHGYVDGEHALAAASVFSGACVRRLQRARLLPPAGVRASLLIDDHFFGLAVRAVGLRIGDFASGDRPLALTWHGLPDRPDQLLAAGKAVVHSVKSWQDQDGDEVRAYFRARRAGAPIA